MSITYVLIDTGSAKSILSADILEPIGVSPTPNDRLKKVKGIGGTEIVYEKQMDFIIIDQCEIPEFTIQIGAMNYGFHKIVGVKPQRFSKPQRFYRSFIY